MHIPRRSKIALGTFLVLVSLIGVALYVFEWNMLRGPIARRVEAATGRAFAINGNLHVHLSLHPRVTVEGITLGNAAWSSNPTMLEVGKLDFRVDAMPLLHRKVIFEELDVSDARVLLEKNRGGVPNWQFKEQRKETEPQQELPIVKALAIDRSHIAFRDPTLNTDVALDISTVPADRPNAGMLQLKGHGRYKAMAAGLDGVIGSVLTLTNEQQPYPVKLHLVSGATKARIDGHLIDPLHFKGEDLNFTLEGSDLAQLFTIVGVPLPPTPPYKLAGHLNHVGDVWTFRRFAGNVGNSDLRGDFSVDRAKAPQLITANLVSKNLDMKDLGGLVGGDRGAKPAETPPPSDRMLPQEPFNLTKLRTANADVMFRGDRIDSEKLPLEKMTAHLKLKDGVLTLDPLNFGVAGGNLVSKITMDARHAVIATRADMNVKQVHLDKLFPAIKNMSRVNAGLIAGRVQLEANGNSVAQMLGGANGDVALIMEGGSVSELAVRLSNLDLAHSLVTWVSGDRQTPVRCMVAHMTGTNGDFVFDPFVLDTDKAQVRAEGDVNFATEGLNVRLVSKPKDFSLVSLRGPIRVTGTFKNPKPGVDVPRLALRGGAAVALGVVTGGLGAILPLLDFGGAKDSNCAALIANATQPQPVPEPRLHSAQR